jgi:hypothetical protein
MKKIVRLTESELIRIIERVINEQGGKPVTGQGNKKDIVNSKLTSWLNTTFGPDALNGTFTSNGTKVTLYSGQNSKLYPEPLNVGGSSMSNKGTWSRIKNSDMVSFSVEVKNPFKVNPQQKPTPPRIK